MFSTHLRMFTKTRLPKFYKPKNAVSCSQYGFVPLENPSANRAQKALVKCAHLRIYVFVRWGWRKNYSAAYRESVMDYGWSAECWKNRSHADVSASWIERAIFPDRFKKKKIRMDDALAEKSAWPISCQREMSDVSAGAQKALVN